jgi:hypothetical protein
MLSCEAQLVALSPLGQGKLQIFAAQRILPDQALFVCRDIEQGDLFIRFEQVTARHDSCDRPENIFSGLRRATIKGRILTVEVKLRQPSHNRSFWRLYRVPDILGYARVFDC